MKTATTTIEQLLITDLMESHRLDPVRVIMEPAVPGEYHAGRLTVIVYGRAWTTYFGNMGKPMREFLLHCNDAYLADRLAASAEPTNQRKRSLDGRYLLNIVSAIREALRQEGSAA